MRPKRLLFWLRFLRILAGIALALSAVRAASFFHSRRYFFLAISVFAMYYLGVRAGGLHMGGSSRQGFCVSVQRSALHTCNRNFKRGYVFETLGEDFHSLLIAWGI